MRTSYSALETFKSCPLKYKFQEIDKIRVPKGVEAVFGSTMHATLKFMFERSPLYPTIDQIIVFFKEAWDERRASINPPLDPDDAEQYSKQGVSLLEKFYKNNQPWNFNAVELESRFEVELVPPAGGPATGEKHILAGIIDRVDKNGDDGSYEIIDYKTAKKMPSQDMLDNDAQMSIYHIGLSKRWPHLSPDKIKLSLYFLKHGEKISTSRNAEQMEKAKRDILATIDDITARIKNNYDFPPAPSGLCDWCGYKKICPMFKHLYEKARNSKSEIRNIEPIISEYFELKKKNDENDERLDELKTVIYGFMDEQKVDRVFGDEGYITKKIQEKFSYDMEGARKILEPIGKWQEILDADDKKLKKLIPSLPLDIQQKLLALRTEKHVSVLTASKKKVDSEEG